MPNEMVLIIPYYMKNQTLLHTTLWTTLQCLWQHCVVI